MKHTHAHENVYEQIHLFNCDDALVACDKNQYENLNFWNKLRLKIHLFYCDYCRGYSRRNQKLSELFRKAGIKTKKYKTLDTSTKDELKKKLIEEMNSV